VPCLQALLGFQFAVVITHSFDKLPVTSKAAHAVALGLIALSTILLMAPAAHHWIVYGGEASTPMSSLPRSPAQPAWVLPPPRPRSSC
jgi:Family of unknown function (DUF6328)